MVMKIDLGKGLFALVDDEDYEPLLDFKWKPESGNSKNREFYYAISTGYSRPRQRISMHRVILGAPDNLMVDHIDGDGLNNQKNNLRLVTNAQNQANQHVQRGISKYKGVCWSKRHERWQAGIKLGGGSKGKKHIIGRYYLEEDAARAYDEFAYKLRGEYAKLNFPELLGTPFTPTHKPRTR